MCFECYRRTIFFGLKYITYPSGVSQYFWVLMFPLLKPPKLIIWYNENWFKSTMYILKVLNMKKSVTYEVKVAIFYLQRMLIGVYLPMPNWPLINFHLRT